MRKKKKKKGIPLDSCPVIKITWCVLAMVEQIWYLSLITSNTTSQTRKEICTRLILVFFYQKQYNSLNTFLNHSIRDGCRPPWQCWVNSNIWNVWFKGTKSVTFLNAHDIHMLFVAGFNFIIFIFLTQQNTE